MPIRSCAQMKTSFHSRASRWLSSYLEVAFQLRDVEIWSETAHCLLGSVVEEGQAEIDQRCRRRLTVDLDVALVQMPTARPDDEGRDDRIELVGLAVFLLEADLA